MRLSPVLCLLSASCLGLHVGYAINAKTMQAATWLLIGGVTLATCAFLMRLRTFALWTTGIQWCVLWGTISLLIGHFQVYATAIACFPLLYVLLQLAHQDGVLKYDTQHVSFEWSRAAFYGGMRAGSVWVFRMALSNRDTADWAARLLPLSFASIETIVMSILGNGGSYTFSPTSVDFVVYATLKTASFAALPYLEDTVR